MLFGSWGDEMENIEHPDITAAMRTGYPSWDNPYLMAKCDELLDYIEDKKIILTVHRPEPSFCGVVKLDRQAEALVKQLQRETGMTAKYIVSQIIIQGFDLVEIKEDKE